MDERESLLGVEVDRGQALVRTRHRDGSCDSRELQPQPEERLQRLAWPALREVIAAMGWSDFVEDGG